MAYSTDWPAKLRAATSNAEPALPSRTNMPFFVPTRSSVTSASCDRREDVDAIARRDGGLLAPVTAVDEDVHVLADKPSLVEHPPGHGRVRMFERTQHVEDGRAL